MATILVIEDELALSRRLARALEQAAHEVRTADCGSEGLLALAETSPDLVMLDLRLPDTSGLEILGKIRELDPNLPVVLMTAYSSVEDAVEAMRRGATDYLPKPLDIEKVRRLVERLLSDQLRDRELAYHRERDRRPVDMLVQAPAIQTIFHQVRRLAAANLPPGKRPTILLTGETGTGKGITARAIHDQLGGTAFIEVNCTAMPSSLVEAELFGHERGSFTDAKTSRTGLFEAAQGGTIFLDEIGHLPEDLQAKFLKVIEEKRVRRVGSSRDRPVDVHVIAATNRDLDAAVSEGRFREDLLHRLRVLCFDVPPLRERQEDIPPLARQFCAELGHLYGRSRARLTEEAERLLLRYPWPGNVRELRNVIERAILLEGSAELGPEAFSALFPESNGSTREAFFALPRGGICLEELEKDLIRQALEETHGNQTRAAALLGLSRHTLRYRLEKYGLA